MTPHDDRLQALTLGLTERERRPLLDTLLYEPYSSGRMDFGVDDRD